MQTEERPVKMSWKAKHFLKAFGPLLLLYLLSKLDLDQIAASVMEASVEPLLLVSCLSLFMMAFKALRWQKLLESFHIYYKFSRCYCVFLHSFFLGNLTPGRLGEVSKALVLRREASAPLAPALLSVILDRLFDVYMVLLVSLFGVWHFGIGGAFAANTSLLACLLIPLATFFHKEKLLGLLWITVEKLTRTFGGSAESFPPLKGKALAQAALWTLFSYAIFYIQCWILAGALNLKFDLVFTAIFISTCTLAAMIPITISGIGVRDAILIYFFGMKNIPAHDAISYSLLFLLCFNLFLSLIGVICGLVGGPDNKLKN